MTRADELIALHKAARADWSTCYYTWEAVAALVAEIERLRELALAAAETLHTAGLHTASMVVAYRVKHPHPPSPPYFWLGADDN